MSGQTKKKVIGATLQLDGERQFRTAVANINTDMRELSSEMRKVTAQFDGNANSMEALEQRADVLSRQYDALSDKTEVYRRAVSQAEEQEQKYAAQLENVRQEYQQAEDALQAMKESTDATTDEIQAQQAVVDELADRLQRAQQEYDAADNTVDKWRTSLNHAEADLANLNRDIDANNQYLQEAKESADGTAKSIDGYGKAVQEAEEDTSVFGDVLKANLASSVVERAVDMLGDLTGGIKDYALEVGDATSQIRAATGATAEEAERYRDIMEDVYNSGAGDSLEDVADAMTQIKQQMGQIDPSKLQELTGYATTLKDTFGWEYQESIRAANALIDNFGISAEQAFNLMVQGAQRGLDKNGDLLDTINEYSVHYSQMGASAEDFFNSLANGTEAGTFSVDKLGDAYKEFGIRVRDTADSTTEGFELIGKDADEMRKKFAAGGESAREAMEETVDALFDVDDAVKRNQAGVDLFGTMWEDLGEDGIRALMDVEGELSMTKNAMEELNNVRYDNASARLEELGRRFTAEVAEPILEDMLPGLENGLEFLADNADILAASITGVGTAIATTSLAVKGLGALASATGLAISAGPIGAVVGVLAGVTVGLTVLESSMESVDEETATLLDQMDATQEKLAAVGETAEETGASLEDIEGEYRSQIQYAENLGDRYYQLADKTERTAAEQLEMKNAVEELCEIIPDLSQYVDETTGLLTIQKDEFEKLTDSALDYYLTQAQAEYAADKARELADAQIAVAEAEEQLRKATEERNLAMEESDRIVEEMAGKQGAALIELQEEHGKTWVKIRELNSAIEEQSDAIDAANVNIAAMEEEYYSLGETMDGVQGNTDGMNDSLGETNTMLVEFNGQTKTVTAEAGAAFQELAGKYDEVYQAAEESIRGQLTLFGEWSENSDVTKETLIENLDSQKEGLENYRENFSNVTDRISEMSIEGSEAFVQALVDANVGASGELKALNAMTEDELEAYVLEWLQVNQEITGSIADTHAEAVTEAGTMYDDMYNLAEVKGVALNALAIVNGEGFSGGVSEGMERNMSMVIGSAGAILDLCDISGDMGSLGDNAGGSFTDAMAEKIRSTISSVTSAVSSVISSVRNRLDSHSPSRVMMGIGDDAGEGFEIGTVRSLEQARLSIDRSMTGIIDDVDAAASKMRLEAHITAEPSVAIQRTGGRSRSGLSQTGAVYQTINIYQPTESPVEMAREMKRAGRELAYGSR